MGLYQETIDLAWRVLSSGKRKCVVFLLKKEGEVVASAGDASLLETEIKNGFSSSLFVKDGYFRLGYKGEKGDQKDILQGFLNLIISQRRSHEVQLLEKETNTFLRHEVKNGILNCLIDCDRAREELSRGDGASTVGDMSPLPQLHTEELLCGNTQNTPQPLLDSQEDDMLTVSIESIAEKLHDTLQVLSSVTNITSILNGSYIPKSKPVDLAALALAHNQVIVNQKHCLVETDPTLVKIILGNAISNAVKYGSELDPIKINLKLNIDTEHEDDPHIIMTVINKPGLDHERLVGLERPNEIFEPGKSFHTKKHPHLGRQLSAGDGAWIMKRCTEALGGTSRIEFKPDETCFIATFCVRRPKTNIKIGLRDFTVTSIDTMKKTTTTTTTINTSKKLTPNKKKFVPPPGTVLCGFDDSAAQRHWLANVFTKMGPGLVSKIWGHQANDLKTFIPQAIDLVSSTQSNFIFFLDRHLHYPAQKTLYHHSTPEKDIYASGIDLGSNLLHQLKSRHLLHRTLIILRSADDDSIDSLHGFVSKSITSVERFAKEIEPLWQKHFLTASANSHTVHAVIVEDEEEQLKKYTTTIAPSSSASSCFSY